MGNLLKETPYSEITASLEALARHGITRKHLDRLRAEPDFAKRVTKFMLCGGYESTTSQKQAREIMSKNFFGVEEAIQHFGVNPSRAQLDTLTEVPLTEEVLTSLADTHILVAVFTLSILDIRGKVERNLFSSHEDSWYNKESFAKDRGKVDWHLVRKTPIEGSMHKKWDEQQAMLGENDATPSARVMVYTVIGHYLATDERLFRDVYVRCSDAYPVGRHVYIGDFDDSGLDFCSWVDISSYEDVGVAAFRKSS